MLFTYHSQDLEYFHQSSLTAFIAYLSEEGDERKHKPPHSMNRKTSVHIVLIEGSPGHLDGPIFPCF